ncbi:hypothetical protein CI109_101007 [Kwoniella shandongensis]|uniref:triacylglycerol lipase n=1 Tax=Kwoniella shandongensis TaxID=1734106 RepID=A0A5M6C8I4_9TREE|nr:uncharacterized protein CI109_001476 [Kwoniella shandongensis]KAA5530072.1 hypothetical protein CI109_001476 [Kwoniella shandongensis]
MHIPLITSLTSSLLPLLNPIPQASSDSSSTLTFSPVLAHVHTYNHSTTPTLLLHNSSTSTSFYAHDYPLGTFGHDDESDLPALSLEPLTMRTTKTTIRRPRIRPPEIISWALSARARQRSHGGGVGIVLGSNSINTTADAGVWVAPDMTSSDGDWEDVEVIAPDMTDRQTIITLAKMTSNAYVTPDSGEWWPVGDWNATLPFGWDRDADGLRGHVFADPKNETVVISIKGTSAGVLGSGGPTAKNDKFNDNLLFSCCCARVDFSWTPVCDCYRGGWKCEQTCLEDALVAESVYATVGTNLYNNVTYMYPNATIWLVGHSLGGSVSSLIALSFGAPAVTFEAPGERLAAQRLHLPLPPGMPSNLTGITHVYHTADPIPMGACNGAYSGCYAAGFALESKCHTGQTILYDTVTVKGWAVDVRTHRIGEIINKVLVDPWPGADLQRKDEAQVSWWWGWGRKGPGKRKPGDDVPDDDDGWEKHGGVPKPESEDDCTDCFRWEFGDGWDREPDRPGKGSNVRKGMSLEL